jgi:hypothetical protein
VPRSGVAERRAIAPHARAGAVGAAVAGRSRSWSWPRQTAYVELRAGHDLGIVCAPVEPSARSTCQRPSLRPQRRRRPATVPARRGALCLPACSRAGFAPNSDTGESTQIIRAELDQPFARIAQLTESLPDAGILS